MDHYDMVKLRKCTLNNEPTNKDGCGDYWGGDIGSGRDSKLVAIRDAFMYARCVNDISSLRNNYAFNISPACVVTTDNANMTLPTDMLIAPNFNAMLKTTSYISNVTSSPYITLAFDKEYSVGDVAIAFGTNTQWMPSYFQLQLRSAAGSIIASKLGSALDTVISTNSAKHGTYWWSFPTPVKAWQFSFSCSSNQKIEIRNISIWCLDMNLGTADCSCFLNTADAALLGYLPSCDSAACKERNIMTTSARAQMNDGQTCKKTLFKCDQILNISPASKDIIMQNVTLTQNCGTAARPPNIVKVTPPPAQEGATDTSGYTYAFVIFIILAILSGLFYYIHNRRKKNMNLGPEDDSTDPADAPADTSNDPEDASTDPTDAPVDNSNGPADILTGPTDTSNGPVDTLNGPTDTSTDPTEAPADTLNGPADTSTDPTEAPADTSNGPADTPPDTSNGPADTSDTPRDTSIGPTDTDAAIEQIGHNIEEHAPE